MVNFGLVIAVIYLIAIYWTFDAGCKYMLDIYTGKRPVKKSKNPYLKVKLNKMFKPDCFQSDPSYQAQAENDCCRCNLAQACLHYKGGYDE